MKDLIDFQSFLWKIYFFFSSVDLETALANYNKYDPHDNILLIVTFYKKDYHNIPLLEIMYRHHFKNILYCGEPDEVVDKYMKHYNGESGTYFSFLPVHHKQSAGYECLLGAIEMGYIGKMEHVPFEVYQTINYLFITRNTRFAGIPRCWRTTAWDQSGRC